MRETFGEPKKIGEASLVREYGELLGTGDVLGAKCLERASLQRAGRVSAGESGEAPCGCGGWIPEGTTYAPPRCAYEGTGGDDDWAPGIAFGGTPRRPASGGATRL